MHCEMNPYTSKLKYPAGLHCNDDNSEIIKSKGVSRGANGARVDKAKLIETEERLIGSNGDEQKVIDAGVIEIKISSPEVIKPEPGETFKVTVKEVATTYCVVKFMKNNAPYEGCMLISNLKEFKPMKNQRFLAVIVRAQYRVEMFGKIYDFFDFEKV